MKITLNVTGLREARRDALQVAARAQDLRPAFRKLEVATAKHSKRLFSTRGRSGASGGWAPRKSGRSARLVASGRLRRGVASRGGERVFLASRTEVYLISTRVPYAGLIHYGTGTTPGRPLIDPTTQDLDDWGGIIDDWILEGGRRRSRK